MRKVYNYVGFLNALDDREKKVEVDQEFFEWLKHGIKLEELPGKKKKGGPVAIYCGMEIYLVS